MAKVCILGAGAAGSLLAIQLLEFTDHDITIVDLDDASKPYDEDAEVSLCYELSHTEFRVPKISALGFGGSTNLWHGLLAKLEDSDLLKMDYRQDKTIINEINASYQRLKNKIPGLNLFDDVNTNTRDELECSLGEKFKSKKFVLQKKSLRTRDLLQKILSNQRITFISNSLCLQLNSDKSEFETVKSITVKNLQDGSISELVGDIFVLSCGALETPRVLLQSAATKTATLRLESVGRNLIDHPWAIIGKVISNSKISFRRTDVRLKSGYRARLGILIESSVEAGGEVAESRNNCVVLKPMLSENYEVFIDLLKDVIFTRSIKKIVLALKKYRVKDLLSFLQFILHEKTGLLFRAKVGLVFAYLEQLPDDSCVTLTNKVDKFGRYIPKVLWRITNNDLKTFENISDVINAKYVSTTSSYVGLPINHRNIYSGCHLAGTCRIGGDVKSSVIDINLKVHQTNNLYICDLSIFSHYGNSNPTLTLFAFADRLAQHLKK